MAIWSRRISQANKETFYIKFEGISRAGPNGKTNEYTLDGYNVVTIYGRWTIYFPFETYLGTRGPGETVRSLPPNRPLRGGLEITLTEDYSEYDFGAVGMTVSYSGSTAIVKLTNVKEGYGANLLIRQIG